MPRQRPPARPRIASPGIACSTALSEFAAPLSRPSLDDDFLLGIEVNRIPALRVKIAEETILPTGERKIRHRSSDANVDPDVACTDFVPELAGSGTARREKASHVSVTAAIHELDRFIDRSHPHHAEHGTEHLGLCQLARRID